MPIESGRAARQLCAAAEEALTEAAFRTGEFTDAERLFGEALTLARQDGDREDEALAVGGLGMARHYRNIAKLVGGLVPADADVAAEDELRRCGSWGYSLALREKLGDPRRIPSALVALGEAEMAAGNLQRAVELLSRALTLAREANLQPWRIQDAEQALRKAEAALPAAS